MSGRSAYVRKKITQTGQGGATGGGSGSGGSDKSGVAGSLGRVKSATASSSDDNATISDFPLAGRQDTGVGTTNARFLKFSEPIRENELLATGYAASHSGGSLSGGSTDGRRDAAVNPHFSGPLQDFAYARARRPVIKTEDVSGIEKSGLRSVLDKKSEEVRKGIAKTFNFRKKDKRAAAEAAAVEKALEFRPQSAATVRPGPGLEGDLDLGYDSPLGSNEPPSPMVPYPGAQWEPQFQHQPWEADPSIAALATSVRSPPAPPAAPLPPIRRWIGAGRPVQRWNKLRKDPELWDPNGDVLVFLGHKGQQPRPNPSFRLSSHIIEATESRYLIMLLREGSNERNSSMTNGAPAMMHRHGSQHGGHGLGPGGPGTRPGTAVGSEADLDAEAQGEISYELYFPSPPNVTRIDQLRYHITTRNVFALMYHASLVGLSLYQTLSDLHARLDTYMSAETDNLGSMVQYLAARGVDDVRGDVEGAVSLLAWSESPEVRWDEGWRESFLHCAGMYAAVEGCADFKNVTPITRALLERACLETQLRVQAAEERLAEFQYADMWPSAVASTASTSGPVAPSPAKGAADRLQKFFLAYYARVYGCWPPPAPRPDALPGGGSVGGDDIWLTRTVAQNLQRDFAALYDYLVNRDIIWDGSEARSGRKWMLVSESGNRAFEPDTPDLPMTDMLVEFDNRLRFPHIPHPYPLVPESIPPTVTSPPPSSSTREKLSKKHGSGGNGAATAPSGRTTGAMERRVALAYTEASNILLLGSDFIQSDLIDAFTKFEKTDRVCEVDPCTARRGRWVLIYGILQTLASVSVDTPHMRYRKDVPYHLSPRLKGAKMPPWKGGGGGPGSSSSSAAAAAALSQEASHELSHCWLVPRAWAIAAASAGGSGAESSAADSSGSSGDSPVRHGGYAFPRPPTAGSTTRGSVAGYTTSSGRARSIRSAGSAAPSLTNYPPFSSTASVVSDSDAGSSILTPASAVSRRGRSNTMKGGRWYESGTIETVNEVEWPVRQARSREQLVMLKHQQHQNQHQQHHHHHNQHQSQQTQMHRNRSNSRHRSASQGPEQEQLALGLPQPGTGGFLVLDDDARSYTTAPTGRDGGDRVVLGVGRGGTHSSSGVRGRAAVLRRDSEADRAQAMVIRDFDDLNNRAL